MTSTDERIDHIMREVMADVANPTPEADALVKMTEDLAALMTNVVDKCGVNSVEANRLDHALLNITDTAEMLLAPASASKRKRGVELLGEYADVSLRRIARHTPPQMCGGAQLSNRNTARRKA